MQYQIAQYSWRQNNRVTWGQCAWTGQQVMCFERRSKGSWVLRFVPQCFQATMVLKTATFRVTPLCKYMLFSEAFCITNVLLWRKNTLILCIYRLPEHRLVYQVKLRGRSSGKELQNSAFYGEPWEGSGRIWEQKEYKEEKYGEMLEKKEPWAERG